MVLISFIFALSGHSYNVEIFECMLLANSAGITRKQSSKTFASIMTDYETEPAKYFPEA